MNVPFKPAHSPFGGSVAARILRCTASPKLIERVPAYLRKSSAYANRGLALHVATARLIERECSLDDLVGATIDNYTITRDDVENSLRPALAYAEALLDAPGAEYYLEHRVVFPGVADTFGTTDLLVRIGGTIHVIDFKFGSGVRVLALIPDGDEDVVNAQLLFYAAAARHSLPEFFAGVDNITLSILQPVVSVDPDAEMVSSVEITAAEIDEFIALYCAACAEALAESPRLARGVWCKFCAAKPICPLFTAPLLDLAQFAVPTPPAGANTAMFVPPSKDAYLQALAAGLDLVDAIRDIGKALHDQAKRALDNGDPVPGYALTAGRAARQWRDEQAVVGALIDLGFDRADVVAEAMRSPHQIELRAKARGLKIPPEFIVSARSGTSLVRAENARVPGPPSRDEIVRTFVAALAIFQTS